MIRLALGTRLLACGLLLGATGFVTAQVRETADAPAIPSPNLDGMEPKVAEQLRDSRSTLDAAMAAGTATAEQFGHTGRRYQAYDILDAAEACYRRAERLAPDDFRWPYLIGVVQEAGGRAEDAAASFRRARASPDRYYPAFIRLATIELELGRLDAAREALALPRQHAPNDPALLAVEGELALRERRYDAALDRLLAALDRQPQASRLHYQVAMAYRALGRTGEARAHLARAGRVGVRPADPILDEVLALRVGEPAFMIEGHTALRAGDLEAAASAFRRAVGASGGTSVGGLVNLAAVEARQGLTVTATDRLRQAQRLDPRSPTVLYNLGSLLDHTGRHAEAEDVFRQLVDMAPGDEGARLGLARSLIASGKALEGLDLIATLADVAAPECAALLHQLDALASFPVADVARRAADEARRVRTLPSCGG